MSNFWGAVQSFSNVLSTSNPPSLLPRSNYHTDPIVEGIRTADYNYRSADTDLFAEADNKQSEESADNTVLLGKQQHWGLHPKTPDEAQVQTTLLNLSLIHI